MEADDDVRLKPPTNDDDDKEGNSRASRFMVTLPAEISVLHWQTTRSHLASSVSKRVRSVSVGKVGPATTAGSRRSSVQSTSTTDGSARRMLVSNPVSCKVRRSHPRGLQPKSRLARKRRSSGRQIAPPRMMPSQKTKGRERQSTRRRRSGSKVSFFRLFILFIL